MKQYCLYTILSFLNLLYNGNILLAQKASIDDDRFVVYVVNSKMQNVALYWQNEKHKNFYSIQHLKNWLEKQHRHLDFAMNGGMYKKDHSAQGLFIENKKVITPIDTSNGIGNFYFKPNGVFYITIDNVAAICKTLDFIDTGNIKYATQSGPMLVMNGQIHSLFKQNSANLNIRNGVGILPTNEIIFVMSKKEINFYDFANYFKMLGCSNALYLDGFVSRTYLPAKNWIQTDGNFGVIIGVTSIIKKEAKR